MSTSLLSNDVRYILANQIFLNSYVGKSIRLEYLRKVQCLSCGKNTYGILTQGFCHSCSATLPGCDICMLKPELCHYNFGTCRIKPWGLSKCFRWHYIYLSITSGVKVGITSAVNAPKRWIDQGAVQALPIFKVSSRFLSGIIECKLKSYFADKTHWCSMLKSKPFIHDLVHYRDIIFKKEESFFINIQKVYGRHSIIYINRELTEINYPILSYPLQVLSHNFIKDSVLEGVLLGIKGQYMILSDKKVFNIRRYLGCLFRFTSCT